MDASTHTRPRFCYLGATGKREDHTLGNISLMLYYYRQLAIDPVMITDYGYFVAASGTTRFESFPEQQVSIFNATCKELSSNGLKWDIYPFSELWQGTLNEALSNEFTIQADGDYIISVRIKILTKPFLQIKMPYLHLRREMYDMALFRFFRIMK